MPNLKNAKKALRQSVVRAERNTAIREHIDYVRRSFRKLLEAKKFDEAHKLMSELTQSLDKAVTKKVMKLNTVSRIKSRAMSKLNTLSK
ncbi:30S ribosomal protein S20 [bacterium]|jgi:ribosomal protein S20|nr:30S ribosomal protein S20 [bacterium]NBX49687.1 30S ribosomal protein S20 [bacterium]